MLTRLTHAAIAFAVTAVVYQVYVLAVVPFVEPSLVTETTEEETTEQQREEARQVLHRDRELFAAYFPADHWTLTTPPKTFEINSSMIVLDDYQPNDKGQLRVNRCVILFFPKQRVRGEPAPRDAIVLEAPHGAVLQMDEGFRLGMGGIGKFQWGKLLGDILVRSDMREPGPQDDLILKTRDLYMDPDMIRTDAVVEMQLGSHHGRGRQLEVLLVAAEVAKSDAAGPNIGGIDTLKIIHDVEALLVPGKEQLFAGMGNSTTSNAPAKVTSQGPFTFDFTHQVASFDKEVQLLQVHENGLQDQLLCDRLNLYFAGRQDAVAPTADRTVNINAVGSKTQGLGRLHPALIEAIGADQFPVRLDAPTQQASARCQSMRIELDSRRITFNSNNEVKLSYQGNEIHAPMLQYEAPPKNSPQRVGALLAAGNGWIVGNSDGKTNQEPFEARWTDKMQLQRINGQPVLSLVGRPRLNMVGLGQLWANHLQIYLRERAADGSEQNLLPGDVVPQRIVATGSVEIDSAELHGKVNKMEVQVDYATSTPQAGQPNTADSPTARQKLARRKGKRSRIYQIDGNQLEMLLTVRDRKPEVTRIDVDGNVVLRETSLVNNGSKPLLVRGNHVRVLNADSPAAEITLAGQPATITAADMSIRAQSLNVNRGTSHAWIDAPGELRLPVNQDLTGKPLSRPQYLTVRWQQGMTLERNVITFRGQVVAKTDEGTLQTEQLILRLTAPVQFDGAAQQQRVELAQLECREGVYAEFSQRDQQGLTSVQKMQLESFVVDQRTGELRGTGPGWIESVHLSNSANNLGALGQKPAVVPIRAVQRLRFLRTEFQQGIRGNIAPNRRKIELFGNTETIYGPVDSWQQRLEISPHIEPGPETVTISSNKLILAESPGAKVKGTPTYEISAEGQVVIDGSTGEHGSFNARAHRARYYQQKTMMILEGNGRHPARLTRQAYIGAPMSETSLQKLMFNHATGEIKGEGLVGGNFKQFDLGRPPAGPTTPRSR